MADEELLFHDMAPGHRKIDWVHVQLVVCASHVYHAHAQQDTVQSEYSEYSESEKRSWNYLVPLILLGQPKSSDQKFMQV